jgi:hypothetical protein
MRKIEHNNIEERIIIFNETSEFELDEVTFFSREAFLERP